EGRFALNPRLQFVGLYQRNNQHDLHAYNVRLAWEYMPLSYVYLVWNSRSYQSLETRTQEQQGIIKISLLKQF
ncbi:MAG: hypothetical protein ACOYXT_01010, partial [Bacteroidota bacterium]